MVNTTTLFRAVLINRNKNIENRQCKLPFSSSLSCKKEIQWERIKETVDY